MKAQFTERAEACGIIGYLGSEKIAGGILSEGIQILQARGYDSAGIVTYDGEKLIITKKASQSQGGGDCIESVVREAEGKHSHHLGIAHTRWATHGEKTVNNAHPHFDQDYRIACIHNGMILNYTELTQFLKSKGIEKRSETDSEIIPLLTRYFIDQENLSVVQAFEKVVQMVDGSNSMVLMDKETPDKLYIAKNAGAMYVGLLEKGFIVASDVACFQNHTSEYFDVEERRVVTLQVNEDGSTSYDQRKEVSKIEHFEPVELKPQPGYSSFLEQEIFEQAEAVARTLNYGARITSRNDPKLGGLDSHQLELKGIDNLVIAACGTSHHAGLFGSYLMRELETFNTVQNFIGSEIKPEMFPQNNPGLMSISQSGETADLKFAIKEAQTKGIKCFNIVNKVESNIAKMTQCGVFINAGRENSVASTKAFTCQVISLALVALWFAEKKNPSHKVLERVELMESIKLFSMKVQLALRTLPKQCQDVARALEKKESMVICGRGLGEIIAKEGALKIQEISYISALAYPSGEFKHGPMALLSPTPDKTPVATIVLDDEFFEANIQTLEQMKGKNAMNIVITDCASKIDKSLYEHVIEIPSCGTLTALLAVIPFQFLTLYLGLNKGNKVDKPQNIAKEQTVVERKAENA